MTRLLLTTLAIATATAQPFTQAPETRPVPPPPAELVTRARVPTLRVAVVDANGNPVSGAFVNYRSLTDGSSGGGATNASGLYATYPGLGSRAGSWSFTWVGPHHLEVGRAGFRTQVVEQVMLVAGETQSLRIVLEPQGPWAPLDADTYARRGAEQVLKAMRGRQDAAGQVNVSGPPTLLPEYARERATRDSRQLPEAFVLATIAVNGKFRESVLAVFRDGVPDVRFSYRSSSGFLPLEEREWKELSAPLAAFYEVAADVTRGPERFDRFLPEDMRRMLDLKAEKNRLFLPADAVRRLSNDHLRRFVALHLDAIALAAWVALADIRPAARLWSPREVRQEPERMIADAEQSLAAVRGELWTSGALEPPRVAASTGYVRRLLGEGLVVREDPARDGIQNLPRRTRMYTVDFASVFPHVVLIDGRLTIVAIDML